MSPRRLDSQPIVDLYRTGLTMRAIAEELRISYPTVSRHLHSADIPIHPPGPRRARVKRSKGSVRWHLLLLEEVQHHAERLCLRDLVVAHLGRLPTRAEISAARRAAHRLNDRGLLTLEHVQVVGRRGARNQVYIYQALGQPGQEFSRAATAS